MLAAVFSPDGKLVATASRDRTARIWQVDDGREIRILKGHRAAVNSVVFHGDNQHVLTASDDSTAIIWNLAGTSIGQVRHDGEVKTAVYSPDGKRILTASSDRSARIWNAEAQALESTLPHDLPVLWAAFTTDGRVFSTEWRGGLNIWSTPESVEPVKFELYVWRGGVHSDSGRVLTWRGHGVRVLDDLEPVRVNDPRLWRATPYCMPVSEREKLLHVLENTARENRERCQTRVRETRE